MSRTNKGKNRIIGNSIRRIKQLFFVFTLIYMFLFYRTYHIQMVKGEEYSQRAKSQSQDKVELNSGRGTIYDRNNVALTDTNKQKVLIVSKYDLISDDELKELIIDATEIEEKEIYKSLEESTSSIMAEIEVDKINEDMVSKLDEKGVLIDEKVSRYSNEQVLTHTIGYIWGDEQDAVSGIEKSMDHILKDSNEEYISVFKAGDVGNNEEIDILDGSIKKIDDTENDNHLRLTVDYNIQKNVEKILSNIENSSAVVISDVKTGEILSLASSPTFIYEDIPDTLQNGKDGEMINKAISSTYCPASVFKMVILYAALDNQIVDENTTYNCTGKIKVGNEEINCSKIDGHGYQTLEQAFANSCNPAFVDISMELGNEKIIEAADMLKLTEKVDIGIEEEKSGYIHEDIEIGSLALGHAEMEFTPLQINQMTQVISNNGSYKPLHIYDSVIDNEFNIIKDIETVKEEELISPYISNQIKEMMKLVSKEGTAKDLKELEGGCGVKTGTVQTELNKKDVEHSWTTGFYPEENPEYVITVFIEGQDINNKLSIPVFNEICTYLSNI